MARITNYANLQLSNDRPTFIGRPVEAIQQTNAILDKRYHQNKNAYESTLDFISKSDVEDRNQQFVDNRKKLTENMFKGAIASNDFEHADSIVSSAIKGVKNDKYLKGAIQSKLQHSAYNSNIDELVKNDKLDINTANRLKSYASNSNSKSIEVDENGVIKNIFSGVAVADDPDINKQVMDYASKLKADKTPMRMPNGKYMAYVDGVFKYTGSHETINEKEATANITQMLMSEPKNRAWFQQQKRLDDADMIVRNNDGSFKVDEQGNPIIDIQQVDQKQKLASIGIDPTQYFKNNAGKTGDVVTNLSGYSKERQNQILNQIYNANYMYSHVNKVAKSGVGIVDYDKIDYKYYQDGLMLAKIKRQWAKDDKEALLAASPRFDFRATPENKGTRTISDYAIKQTKLKNEVDNAKKMLEIKATAAGILGNGDYIEIRGEGENRVVGVVSKDNNGNKTFVDIHKIDGTGVVGQEYLDEYVGKETKYKLAKAEMEHILENAKPGLLKEFKLASVNQIINSQLFYPTLAKNGNPDIILKLKEAGVGSFKEKGFSKRFEILPSEVDKVIEIINKNGGEELFNKQMQERFNNIDETTKERYTQLADDMYGVTASVYKAIPITKSIIPGTKYLSAAATNHVVHNYMSAIDLNGQKVFKGKSNTTSDENIESAIQNGNLNISYTDGSGKSQFLVQGSYKDDKKVPHNVEFLIDAPNNFGTSLQTQPEQIQAVMSHQFKDLSQDNMMFQSTNINAGITTVDENGEPLKVNAHMKTTRVPIDAKGNVLSKNSDYKDKQVDWLYQIETGIPNTSTYTKQYTKNINDAINLASQMNYDLKTKYGLIKHPTKKSIVLFPSQVTPNSTDYSEHYNYNENNISPNYLN